MLHQLHCSQSCRILKDLLKSYLKLLIPVVVHLKTECQLRLFKDCISSFLHNVFQFPRYIMPYLKSHLTFFFSFLFYNLAYSILNPWNVLYPSSLMNFCVFVLFFPPQNFTSNKPLPFTHPQFLGTMIKPLFTVCIDFSALNYVFSIFILYTFQMQ